MTDILKNNIIYNQPHYQYVKISKSPAIQEHIQNQIIIKKIFLQYLYNYIKKYMFAKNFKKANQYATDRHGKKTKSARW